MQLVVINQRTLLSTWTEECIANVKLQILCHILIKRGFGGPKVGSLSRHGPASSGPGVARPVFYMKFLGPAWARPSVAWGLPGPCSGLL